MSVKLLASYKNSVYFDIANDMINNTYDNMGYLSIDDEMNALVKINSPGVISLKYYGLVVGKKYRCSINVISSDGSLGSYVNVSDNVTSFIYTESVGISTGTFTAENDFILLTLSNNFEGKVTDFFFEEVDYTNIDMLNELDLLLNFETFSIGDITRKTFIYSKELMLPRTSANAKFFRNYFDTNQDYFMNYKKKISAIVSFDDVSYRKGFLMIKEINEMYFSAIFYEETIDLTSKIGNKLLEDLDLSDYDHQNSRANIIASWSDYPEVKKYVYPFVDYGMSYYGLEGYCLQEYDDLDGRGLLGHDLFPAMGTKYLLDKIITEAGYTYTSSFLDSDEFKKLIIPYSNDINELDGNEGIVFGCSAGDINPFQLFGWKRGGGTLYWQSPFYNEWLGETIGFTGDVYYGPGYGNGSPNVTYDSAGFGAVRFNTIGYDYYDSYGRVDDVYANKTLWSNFTPQIANDGKIPWLYNVKKASKYKCHGTINLTGGQNAFYQGNKVVFVWVKISSASLEVTTTFDAEINEDVINTLTVSVPPEVQIAKVLLSNGTNVELTEHTFNAKKGDIIYLAAFFNQEDRLLPLDGEDQWTNGIRYNITGSWGLHDMEYSINQTVNGSDVVPQNTKQIDFLKSIVKMFNLYIEPDREKQNNLIIEPRDSYYLNGSGTTHDWTALVDLDSVKYNIPSWEAPNKYKFQHKKGKDFYNIYYDDALKDRYYGTKVLTIDNDLSKSEVVVDDMFIPTWIKELTISGFKYDNISPLICTRVLKHLPTTDNPNASLKEVVNRDVERDIFMTYYDFRKLPGSDTNKYRWYFDEYLSKYYPYTGHVIYPLGELDSANTNYNLQWNTEQYGTYYTELSNNCLYNLHYRKQIEQIKNKNALKMTGEFYLKADDVLKLDFSNKIFINGTYYNILKIIDFNPGKPTKVELLKVIDDYITDYEDIITGTTSGGGLGTIGVNTLPLGVSYLDDIVGEEDTEFDGDITILGKDNIFVYSDTDTRNTVIITGDDNTVMYDGTVISGDNNKITSGGTIIDGDDNIIDEFANVSLISSSNVTVTSSSGRTTNSIFVGVGEKSIRLDDYEEGVIFIGDMVIENGSIKSDGYVIDAGEDEVQNPFGMSTRSVIDCGEDMSTKNYCGETPIDVSDCGTDKV